MRENKIRYSVRRGEDCWVVIKNVGGFLLYREFETWKSAIEYALASLAKDYREQMK